MWRGIYGRKTSILLFDFTIYKNRCRRGEIVDRPESVKVHLDPVAELLIQNREHFWLPIGIVVYENFKIVWLGQF